MNVSAVWPPETILGMFVLIESVQLRDGENQDAHVAFSPRFERVWLESKKRLPVWMERKPLNAGSEASTLAGCTVGLKSMSGQKPKAFRSRIS
jgi:hypothetical protein